MKELLVQTLETIFPGNVYLQGTLNPDDAYSDTFVTFFTDAVDFDKFYDDEYTAENWSFSVMVYSTDPELLQARAQETVVALRAAGFIIQSGAHDILSDVITHTGWAIDVIFPRRANQ